MQLKKNPRDERYDLQSDYNAEETPEAPAFEEMPVNRRTRDAEGGESARATEPHGESVIDAASTFDGRYETAQDLTIQGTVSGEIVCRGTLTIERDAVAKARLEARDARVRGQVEGDIVCSGRLVLASTAVVTGTIKVAGLVVEEGAAIRGTIEAATAGMGPAALPLEKPAARGSARKEAPAPAPEPTEAAAAEPPAAAAGGNGSATRWTRTREVPSFALVSNEDRTGHN